jgi:plasmid stabilization system protein ParE
VLPTRYRIILLPRASNDIAAICSYIEQDSPQNAAIVAQSLMDAIDALEILPHRYRVHEHRRDPALTVRCMPVPPFLVYYRVDDMRQAVRILTVRHGHRRQPRRFR